VETKFEDEISEELFSDPAESTENPYTKSFIGQLQDTKETFQNISWSDNKNKGLMCCTSCCLLFAIFSFSFAFIGPFLVGTVIHDVVTANAVVSSEDSPGYSMWVTNVDNIAPPEYECFNFFNLTNYLDIANNASAIPVYDELGPYCYRLNHEKQNVQWSDDGNEVNYRIFQNYVWAPEVSQGDALNDIVVNLSPGYIGILATTGTEFDLTMAFNGPSYKTNMEWLTTEFVHHNQIDSQKKSLTTSQNNILANGTSINEFYTIWANSTYENSTLWNGMLVSYNGISSGISIESASMLWDSSIEYSLVNSKKETGELWFNATLPDTSSYDKIPNIETRTSAQAQIQSIFNLTSSQTEMLANWLRNSFFIDVVNPSLISDYADEGVEVIEDLGWLQWGSCGVTGLESASKKYYFKPGGTIEYGCFILGRVDKMNITETKKLLTGENGLFQMVNVGKFYNYYLTALNPLDCPINTTTELNRRCSECNTCYQQVTNCTSNRSSYTCTLQNGTCINQYNTTDHCKSEQVPQLCDIPSFTDITCDGCKKCYDSEFNANSTLNPAENCTNCSHCKFNSTDTPCDTCDYCEECQFYVNCYNDEMWDYIEETWGLDYDHTITFVAYMLYTYDVYATPYLEKLLFGAGAGLFPIRTVNDWIFDAKDPLMALANPVEPNAGNLIQNMTSPDDIYNYGNITTYTGLKNISQTASYKSYAGMSTIEPPFWNEPVPIEGCTEWGQFEPFLNERDVKDLYTFDSTYLRTLHLQRTGSVEYRGVPMWRFMLSNDTLMPDPVYYQTIPGFANSTSFHEFCPIFYSNPHWAGVEDYYADKVIGVKENRNYLTDYSVIDVEPITGMVMHVNESLQVNVFLKADYDHLNLYYSPPLDTFYPIIIVYKESTLSKENAAEYQIGIVWGTWFQTFSFGLWLGICLISLVFALIVFIKLLRRNETNPVEALFDETTNLIQ